MKAKRRAKATVKQRVQLLTAVIALGAVFAGVGVASSPSWFTGSNVAPAEAVEQPVAAAPAEPTVAWTDDFGTGGSVALTAYTGARGNSYTVGDKWGSLGDCNGILLSWNSSLQTTQCNQGETGLARSNAKRLADVLGQVSKAGVVGSTDASRPTNASDSTTKNNRALIEWTARTEAASSEPVASTTARLNASGGYYVVRVDVAEASCTYNSGRNNSKLLIWAAGSSITEAPLRLCSSNAGYFTSDFPSGTSSWGSGGTSVRAQTLTSDGSVYSAATNLPIGITNQTTTGDGNDFAIDNLRVLDATPQLTKAFSDESIYTGATTTLTFTVTNTAEKASKNDWSFTDTLPAGLKPVANTFGGSCANVTGSAFTRSVNVSAGTITVAGGDLARGAESCTITVGVTSTTAGTYTNGAANISNSRLKAPQDATLIVSDPATITVRHILQRAASADQFSTTLLRGTAALAESTSTGTANGLQSAAIDGFKVDPGVELTIHTGLVSGAGLNYGTTYSCDRGGVIIASGQAASGSIVVPDEPGANVVCTFTTAPRTAQYNCDPHHFYSVSENGEFVQADIVTGRVDVLRAGTTDVTGINALAVAPNGSAIWGLGRTGTDAGDVSYIAKGTADGTFALPGGAYTPVDRAGTRVPGGIVAGAIDLESGRYLFGKFNAGSYYLWSFTESSRQFAFVGSFPTGGAVVANGDMAFDAKGNLSVLGAASSGSSSTATIFTVTKQNLANPAAGVLTTSSSVGATLTGSDAAGFPNVNGLAFSPRGTVYLSNATGSHEYDPTTWKRVPGTAFVASGSVDLASCSSPSTITVQKNVVGRADSEKKDQFTIALRNGNTTTATATTSGTANGRQAAQIGPYPAPIGSTLTIAESMAAGSVSALAVYTARYECWVDGERVLEGAATSASIAIPDRFGVAVNCTFFNAPLPAASVTVTKKILDPASGAAIPTAGWTVGATSANATVLPSSTPTQQTDANGVATWSVLLPGSATSSIEVSETIRKADVAKYVLHELSCVRTASSGAKTSLAALATTSTTGASGDVTITATVSEVGANGALACVFINRPIAKLTLVEQVGFGSVRPGAWTLTATGPGAALTGRSSDSSVTGATVSPGVAYRLAEAGGPASYVQVGAWSCVDGDGKAVTVSAAGDVTIALGASVICTVTNSTAGLTILKNVIDPQTGFEAKNWTITATPNAFTGLSAQSKVGAEYSSAQGGNAASTIEVRPGHGYTLSEKLTDPNSPLAYRQMALQQRQTDGTWLDVDSASITAPAAGQTAVYRFVNAPIPGIVLPLTGGMSTDAFLIAGALILLLAMAFAVVHGARRRRRGTA